MKKKTSNVENDIFKDQSTRYFDANVVALAKSMPNEEMINLIADLESDRKWVAIVKYSMERIALLMSGIYAADPIKEPSQISKYQGILVGILDVNGLMTSIKEKRKEDESKKNGSKTKDDIKPY